MTVKDLISKLESFDDDMVVRIGIKNIFGGCGYAMNVDDDIDIYNIEPTRSNDYKAVVITEGFRCGSIDYNNR